MLHTGSMALRMWWMFVVRHLFLNFPTTVLQIPSKHFTDINGIHMDNPNICTDFSTILFNIIYIKLTTGFSRYIIFMTKSLQC